MKAFRKFDFLFCGQHDVHKPPADHSSRCLYASELKPSKFSVCSVVSSTSVCSDSSSQVGGQAGGSTPKLKAAAAAPSSYRNSRRFCCRRSESAHLTSEHPSKVPLIIERFTSEKRLPALPRCQFMLPPKATVAQLQAVIRKRVADGMNVALYILIETSLPALDETVGDLAARFAEDDGWLYVRYSSEDTLG